MKCILQAGPMVPWLEESLARDYEVLMLHKQPDRDAFLAQQGARVEGLVTSARFGADRALMEKLPNLRVISSFGVGYETIDVDYAQRRGIPVGYTPDVLNDCVADTAIALIVCTLRRLPQSDAYLRCGHWAVKGPYPLTTSLGGKTLGILGFGRIGEAIAKRALAMGMRIRYHNRRKKDVAYPYDPDPVTLAQNSDVLMVVTPGGEETRNLVGAKVLDALGPEGYLVNIARGSVIDEPLLLRYLQERRIAGAGLDVFVDEPRVPAGFFTLENCVLFPHVGSATVETRKAMGDLQIENLRLHFSGRPVRTRVV
jgi:lactate dehydrogenase-like 2-hydroxyacid dehydrogenase